MAFLRSMDISSSGLTAQKVRMDLISQNIANADTTRTETGDPYRRKLAVFQEREIPFSEYMKQNMSPKNIAVADSQGRGVTTTAVNGVRVSEVVEDQSPFKYIYNPNHPDADQEGYVRMPNVDVMTEMVNLISATRSYEANAMAINGIKSMALKALEIGKG